MPRRNASASQLAAVYAMAQTESKPCNNDAGLLVNDMRLFRSYVCKCGRLAVRAATIQVTAASQIERPRLFVVTSHRVGIGKVDLELGKFLPVVCLCPDPRDIAFSWDPRNFSDWDALIVGTQEHIPDVRREYGKYFRSIEPLEDVSIRRGRMPVLTVHVY